jgi:Berberine and berberine like
MLGGPAPIPGLRRLSQLRDRREAIAREAYGCNYDRLVALKNKYDLNNFFQMNHNIKPSQTAPAKTSG